MKDTCPEVTGTSSTVTFPLTGTLFLPPLLPQLVRAARHRAAQANEKTRIIEAPAGGGSGKRNGAGDGRPRRVVRAGKVLLPVAPERLAVVGRAGPRPGGEGDAIRHRAGAPVADADNHAAGVASLGDVP